MDCILLCFTGRCVCGVPEHDSPPFDFGSLHRAWLDCRRGKGNALARWRFEAALEANLIELAEELRARSYRPSPSVCFVSDQPKRREIFAAAFRDRVVHHLLVRQIEPYWERRFIHDSYACRRGKGTLAAVERVQQFIRQVTGNGSVRAWYLHLDVRSFFVRIDKAILLCLLENGLARQSLPWVEDLRWLVRSLVLRDPAEDALRLGRGFGSVPTHKSLYQTGNRTGLPIGNYSSQFFANVYLDGLDQFVKHELRQRCYLRYIDDLLLLDRDPDGLRECEARIDAFLRRECALDLNPAARVLAPTTNGIDALGYIVHREHRLLRRRTVRRFERRLAAARDAMLHESAEATVLRVSPAAGERLLAECMSYHGLLRHAASGRLLQGLDRAHAWTAWLWRLTRRGRVRRRTRTPITPNGLAMQWRALKRLWPGARLLLQVGGYWEAYGADARWLRAVAGLRAGPVRSGFAATAGFRRRDRALLRRIASASDRPLLLFRQTGRRQGAVRERVLATLIVPRVLRGEAPAESESDPRPSNGQGDRCAYDGTRDRSVTSALVGWPVRGAGSDRRFSNGLRGL